MLKVIRIHRIILIWGVAQPNIFKINVKAVWKMENKSEGREISQEAITIAQGETKAMAVGSKWEGGADN